MFLSLRHYDEATDGTAEEDEDEAGEGDHLQLVLPPHLEHLTVISERRHKVDSLRRAIHATGAERALVFLNFGRRLPETAAKLRARGMPVGVLHGRAGGGVCPI